MIYLQYFFLAIVNFVLTFFVAYPFAPILPLFATQQEGWMNNHAMYGIGPRLPTWLNWLMTPDNSLNGDMTFQLANGISYWSKVKWLWRNPAYNFGLRYLNAPYSAVYWGDKTIKDNDGAKAGWCFVKANGLFQFVFIKRIFSTSSCIYVNCGWNIRALVDDNVVDKPNPYQATFAFTPIRKSGFR